MSKMTSIAVLLVFGMQMVNCQINSGAPSSPLASLYNMSPDRNAFTPIDIFGLVFGFIVFGTGYIYVSTRIFVDTIQRGKGYDEEIENDLMVMHQLGMDNKMDDINKELDLVLAGLRKEDDQDD